jgi:hypothetical protein
MDSVKCWGGGSVPTKYSTLVQPSKKLPTILPSHGIKLLTKKVETKIAVYAAEKKKDYGKADCNVLKQLIHAAHRYTHARCLMHARTYTSFTFPFALTILTSHTLCGTTAFT